MQTIAITGATGFAGSHLIDHLAPRGDRLRCLARTRRDRALDSQPGVEWVPGSLTDTSSIDALVTGADTVIHMAGLTRALGPGGFHQTNTAATAMLIAAARRAGVRSFILVSSLAASRPGVSPYAWSKALAEEAAHALAGDMQLIILRPPAILGPGDSATRDVMALLRRGWLVHPGRRNGSTFSWIDVGDMAALVGGLAMSPPAERQIMIAPCSGQDISWQDVASTAETITGRKVRTLAIPPVAVRAGGVLTTAIAQLTRRPMILSRGKAAELLQPEWHAGTVVDAPTPLHQTLTHCFLHTGD